MRRSILAATALLTAGAITVVGAPSASAEAIVIHPSDISCYFEPGDVPGVDVSFPAKCMEVISDSGVVTVVASGQLPAGYSLTKTFVGPVPCFGGTGMITATVSGRVNATCHFMP